MPPTAGVRAPAKARWPFLKVEAAGNDFVLLDRRRGPVPALGKSLVHRLLDRHRGVGGDGLLLVEAGPGTPAAKVRYWNADGGRAAFCGNGARCVALILLERSGPGEVEFLFGRRRLRARRTGGGRIAILTPPPCPLSLPRSRPPLPSRVRRWVWLDSGVPHWCFLADDLADLDLEAVAPPLRRWRSLGRGGTNVDAMCLRGGAVEVRTFERGVEGETEACGSGLVAAGFWAAEALGVPYPVSLRSRGGDGFRLRPDAGGRGLWLEGPARVVYRGELDSGAL